MKTSNSLSLRDIRVCPFAPFDPVTSEFPATERYGTHRDFLLYTDMRAVSVHLTFINERVLEDEFAPGIRRKLSIAFIDTTDGTVISNARFPIYIPRGEMYGVFRADLPFSPENIDSDHSFKVLVKDTSSGTIFAEKIINFFDEKKIGNLASEWFSGENACIISGIFSEKHRSFVSQLYELEKVRFNVKSNFRRPPFILPEFEVRIFFPDGKIQRSFENPVITGADGEQIHATIETEYFVTEGTQGLCYAELICLDYAIAGFAFSSDGPDIKGEWSGEEIEPLPSYSLTDAAERFRKYTPAPDNEFDQLLDQFIESQQDHFKGFEEDDDLDDSDSADQSQLFDFSDNDNSPSDIADDSPAESETKPASSLTGEEIPLEMECKQMPTSVVESDSSPLEPLENLTGLKSVKEKIAKYEKLVKFNRFRIDAGLPTPDLPLHAMFLGSPGTGKTTVAKLMGKMLHSAGVLTRGHVIIKERATLLGQNYSSESENTLKALEEAQGGILLIDEAYQLFQPKDPRDPGKFVIETLLTALADDSNREWMLILAGYSEPMKQMFEMNPGFKSRIPESNIYTFEDFTEGELMEIAERYIDSNRYALTPDAHDALSARLSEDYRRRDETFGNARHVINMIKTDILPSMAVRVIESGNSDIRSLTEIQPSDIPGRTPNISKSSRPRIGFC